jgi:phosphoglycolate phosphatase
MSRRFNAALFDLDGTLLDTVIDISRAANRMLETLGRPAVSTEDVGRYIGKGIPVLVHRVLTDDLNGKAEAALFERALALFETFYAEESGRAAVLYPNAIEGLRRLQQADIRLACVTNKASRYTHDLLEQAGLAAFFPVIVSGDTLPVKKPDPRPVLHACTQLGVAPAEAVMIGDSANDVQAGRSAGLYVIAVPYGYNEGRPADDLGADRIVADIVEAAVFLGA